MQSRQSRNNPQIWRMAKYCYNHLPNERHCGDWQYESEVTRNFYYDQSVNLMKKIHSNFFTGPDNHKD